MTVRALSPAPDPTRLGRALPAGTVHYEVELRDAFAPATGAYSGVLALYRCYLDTGEVVLRWVLDTPPPAPQPLRSAGTPQVQL